MNKEPSIEKPWNRIFWLTAAPVLGVIGYASLYLIGLTYHETYLDHFSVNPGLFPKSSTELFTLAYLALLHIGISWLGLISNYKAWLYLTGFTSLILIEIIIINKLPKLIKKSKPNNIIKNKILRNTLVLLSIPISISAFLLLIPIAANIFLLAPAFVGVHGAKISIKNSTENYKTECESATKEFCVRLMDENKEISRGYVISASNSHIALVLGEESIISPLKNYRIEKIIPIKKE